MNSRIKKPVVIVVGNEKGGTGKSTVSMHLIVSFLRMGLAVGSIDVDARQGSLSRYIENRQRYAVAHPDTNIPLPVHKAVFRSDRATVEEIEQDERNRLVSTLGSLSDKDVILIDTPGTDSYLSRLAHSYADTLITPLNDSLIDLDMLVRIEGEQIRPSIYAEMVWEQKKTKAMRDGGSIDWIILRNRLSNLNARNKEEVERVVNQLAKRMGVRVASGFGERVIFKELFPQGLTLLDLPDVQHAMSLSHVAARQELRNLVNAIKVLPMSPMNEALSGAA